MRTPAGASTRRVRRTLWLRCSRSRGVDSTTSLSTRCHGCSRRRGECWPISARGERRRGALLARLAVEPTPRHETEGDRPLRCAMARLSDRDREVLMLAAWEQLAPAEIAAVLGCSRSAANVRLHRARKRLLAALERERDEAYGVGTGVVS